MRKFTDLGLCVYLDNKQVNIYNPISKESFLLGIYQKPYWIVEFEVNKASVNFDIEENKIVAYVTTRNMTQLKATETVEACENESETENRDREISTAICSDFENTIRDRKLSEINTTTEKEKPTNDVEL